MAALTVVAAYDVSSDNRRARLAALLQAHGDRVQRSVFVLRVDDTDLAELQTQAEDVLDLDEDSLYLFGQCGPCWQNLRCVGQAHPREPVLFWAVL
jgi:CRISPR-associated protein Cas2